MKPDLTPPDCPYCRKPASLEPTSTRYRRGNRTVTVPGWTWQCSDGCEHPDAPGAAFRFSDSALMRWTDGEAARLWQLEFGEAMPPSRRGKRRAPKRSVRVPVMLTEAEAKRLDRLRGDRTRSEFLRDALQPSGRKTG